MEAFQSEVAVFPTPTPSRPLKERKKEKKASRNPTCIPYRLKDSVGSEGKGEVGGGVGMGVGVGYTRG